MWISMYNYNYGRYVSIYISSAQQMATYTHAASMPCSKIMLHVYQPYFFIDNIILPYICLPFLCVDHFVIQCCTQFVQY